MIASCGQLDSYPQPGIPNPTAKTKLDTLDLGFAPPLGGWAAPARRQAHAPALTKVTVEGGVPRGDDRRATLGRWPCRIEGLRPCRIGACGRAEAPIRCADSLSWW